MKKFEKYLESIGKDTCYYYIPKAETSVGEMLALVKSGEAESVRTFGEDKWQVSVQTEKVEVE